MLLAGYSTKAYQGMGDAYLLPAIAAVVIGGTNILGGQGRYVGTVVGTILITLLSSRALGHADARGRPPDHLRRGHHRHAAGLRQEPTRRGLIALAVVVRQIRSRFWSVLRREADVCLSTLTVSSSTRRLIAEPAADRGRGMETKIDERALDERLAALEAARAWSPRTISRLETLVRSRDDEAVFRVNPVKFAAERDMAEAETVDLFLHAAAVGLFAMDWLLLCPMCSCVVGSFGSLRAVDNHYHCSMCQTDYEAKLDDYIAVTFTDRTGHSPDRVPRPGGAAGARLRGQVPGDGRASRRPDAGRPDLGRSGRPADPRGELPATGARRCGTS